MYFTYVVEVVHITMTTRETFRILAAGWGDPEALIVVGWLGVTIPILVSICSTLLLTETYTVY